MRREFQRQDSVTLNITLPKGGILLPCLLFHALLCSYFLMRLSCFVYRFQSRWNAIFIARILGFSLKSSRVYLCVSCSWATFTYLFYWFLLKTIHPLVMCLYKWFLHSCSISWFMHDSIFVILGKIDGLHCLWTIWHVMCEGRPSYLHVVLRYDVYVVAQEICSWFMFFSRVLHAITLHLIISAKFCNLHLRCKSC